MTAGDSSSWDDLFHKDLIPQVLSHVIGAWGNMVKPGVDDHEDDISVKLYAALLRSKDRQRHMFLIDYQSVEVDVDLDKEIGRKDIVFRPTLSDERVYFCLEAKRLNAVVSGIRRSLADEYVKEGMQRFVDGKYSRFVSHGGMLAYVLDGQITRAIKNVENNIRTHRKNLGMDDNGELVASTIRPDDPDCRESSHRRMCEPGMFCIHHLFVGPPSMN